MARGATIITPNNRLAHQLLRNFLHHSGSNIHDKPRCYPYSVFLRHCYKQVEHHYAHQTHPILLNAHQEHALWQLIINENALYPCTNSLVLEVQSAWTHCQQWEIDMESSHFQQTPQTKQFQTWHQQYLQRLQDLNAITEAQLVPYLLRFSINIPLLPMIWVSFDDFTPQQNRLRASINSPIEDYDIETRSTTAKIYAAKDTQDELHHLVTWLKDELESNTSRIGVIVPDLQQQSDTIQRHLLRSIPADQLEFSVGKALSNYPLVSHALHWLLLDKATLHHHQMRLLLLSPFIGGGQSELHARTKLLETSPHLQESTIPYLHFLKILQNTTPKLYQLLEQLSEYPLTASADEWVGHFKIRLQQLGFPGEYTLHSAAFQTLHRLQSLLDELPALSLIHKRMTKIEAITLLQNMVASTVFQVRTTPRRIQVSGLLEASGCEFDKIWVMGLTDQCLPQKVKLSPFIPHLLQRNHHMPHAVPERELQLAKQLLERLNNGARQCIFSYPCFTGDAPNLPSPLLHGLSPYETLPILPVQTEFMLKEYQEHYTYPLLPQEVIEGGTSLLANQAKCPFRAFAAHRLHTKEGIKQSTGLNQAERGQIIHKVLELLWQSLGSQEVLLQYLPADLDALIDQVINTSLKPYIEQRHCSFSPFIQSIEQKRLKRLVHASLEWEKQRPPFRIKAVEQAYHFNLAELDFRVRIDRLDSIAEGQTWVIDYKSKLPTQKPWNEDRPEAPQLLLYALLDTNINALLFLQLKTGTIACSGISQEKQMITGLASLKQREEWSDRRDEWHEKLTALAVEFREGHCMPSPQRESTCLTCEYKNLCRVT